MFTEITKQEERENVRQSSVFAAAAMSSATTSTSTTTGTALPPPSSNDAPKRLTKEGTAILENFMLDRGVSYSPSNTESARLAQRIREETRYEAMDAAKVKQWFARRRQEIRKKQQEAHQRAQATTRAPASLSKPKAPTTNPGTSVSQAFGNFGQWLAPKLTQPQIDTLEVMRNKDGCIDDALIKSLADSWSLPKSVVENYLREHPPKTREPLTPVSPTVPHRRSVAGGSIGHVDHRLPTPADSVASPSLSYAGDAFAYSEGPHMEVLPSEPSLAPTQSSSAPAPPACSDDMDVDQEPTPWTASLSPTEILFKAILEGVRGVPETGSLPTSRPSDAAELAAAWPALPCLEEALSQIF